MLIHLVGSSSNLEKDYPYLKAIIDTVTALHEDLARNWVDTANNRMSKHDDYTAADWEEIMNENSSALASADVLIVEGTNNRFSQGYQMAAALAADKPVLLLYRGKDARSFSGMEHDLLSKRHYEDENDIRNIITEFIEKYRLESAHLQLNFKMSLLAYRHLRHAVARTDKTESQILNSLLEQNIKG